MIFIILLTILFILILEDYLKKKRLNKIFKANGVGSPKFTLPLIGDVFLGIGLNAENLQQFLKRWRQNYGKVYTLWYLKKCVLVVQDVEYVEHILSSSRILKKSFFYDQLTIWLGNGLLLSSGIKWQKSRKTIAPTLNFQILEQFVEIFDQQAHVMVEKLRPQANGANVIDVFPLVCSTTLEILLETAMGVKITTQSKDIMEYTKALKRLVDIISERFLKPIQNFDLTFKLFYYKSYRTLRKNVQILHTFSEKIINKKREKMMNLENDENDQHDVGRKKRMTFLDALLQTTIDGKPLTNKEIREEVDTFTFGAHDTTASAISFILYVLARHPKVQLKVVEEILNIVGPDKDQPVSMQDLQKMKYLECVIKETLRLYPPAPIIGRVTEEDYKMGDKIIPCNTNIMFLIFALCRDPDYFSRPDEFIPERFENEKINPYAFVPFSAGPRSCFGQKFAYLQMKSIVSCILRNYELLPLGPEVVCTVTVIMRSKTGVNVGLKPRQFQKSLS